jgi:hypothetical protein
MWSTTLLALLTVVAAPSPANATRPCPYWVSLSRENFPGERAARICDLNRIAEWLGAVPDAARSTQRPQGALNDGFTVTIVTVAGQPRAGTQESAPGIGKVLLTEKVYPVAGSGPVAFVPSRSVLFHHPGPFPKWVVYPGWRRLDATEPIPPVLTRLGMMELIAATPTVSAAPTPPARSGSRGPDLVTLLFLVAILASVGAFARRSIGRTDARVGEDRSETLSMEDDLRES